MCVYDGWSCVGERCFGGIGCAGVLLFYRPSDLHALEQNMGEGQLKGECDQNR